MQLEGESKQLNILQHDQTMQLHWPRDLFADHTTSGTPWLAFWIVSCRPSRAAATVGWTK